MSVEGNSDVEMTREEGSQAICEDVKPYGGELSLAEIVS